MNDKSQSENNSIHYEMGFTAWPTAEPLEQLVLNLPAPQQQRAATLKRRRRSQFVLGRWVLLRLATRYGESVLVHEREQSSPQVVVNEQPFYCSVSHCEVGQQQLAVAVLSTLPVGVDIEPIKSAWSTEKARLFCTDAEIEFAGKLVDERAKDEFFTRCWTRKEAFSKFHQRSVWHPDTVGKTMLNVPLMQSFKLVDGDVLGSIYGLEHSVAPDHVPVEHESSVKSSHTARL